LGFSNSASSFLVFTQAVIADSIIKPVQENGALVIPALNIFRYSEENHRTEAKFDAERLLKAGVDGFQIDCIYQDYFKRQKVYHEK